MAAREMPEVELKLEPTGVATKAWEIPLTPDMTSAAAFEEIALACLRQFRLNEPLILDARDAEGLHQARVALRRLRSALSIHKKMVADKRSEALSGELRWLTAELGRARDLDVLIKRTGDGALLEPLGKARRKAYAAVESALGSSRARGLMIDLVDWIAVGAWHTSSGAAALRDLPAGEFAPAALDRLLKRVIRRGRDLEELDDKRRHELRKAGKKLRYGAEFFGVLYGTKPQRRRYKRFIKLLEALQDQLGALNDLVTAPELLRSLHLDREPEARCLIGASKKRRLLSAAAECHDALIEARPFWR